jgi:hypothetical protein
MSIYIIDANAIKEFQDERANGISDNVQKSVDYILSIGSLALDEGDQILTEWHSCSSHAASTMALEAWVDTQMQKGKIKIFTVKNCKILRKKMISLGMPAKDIKYVQLAKICSAHSLITNDIDFHDPKKKKATVFVKDRLKANKNGTVCKYLQKDLSLNVISWSEVYSIIN